AWVNSAGAQPVDGATLQARLVGVGGEVYAAGDAPAAFAGNAATLLASLDCRWDGVGAVCLLDLTLVGADGAALSSNRYTFTRAANLAPLLGVAPTTLGLAANASGLSITNTGDTAALFVWLEDARPLDAGGFVYFGDNYFSLF